MGDDKERERFRSAFGAALEQQLGRRGLSQAALAARLGTSRSYLNQTMTGNKTASPEWADRVAEAVEATPTERRNLHIAAAAAAGYKVGPAPRRFHVEPKPRTRG